MQLPDLGPNTVDGAGPYGIPDLDVSIVVVPVDLGQDLGRSLQGLDPNAIRHAGVTHLLGKFRPLPGEDGYRLRPRIVVQLTLIAKEVECRLLSSIELRRLDRSELIEIRGAVCLQILRDQRKRAGHVEGRLRDRLVGTSRNRKQADAEERK